MTRKKLLLFGFIFVMLVAIPLTLYVIKNQQQTQSHAEKSTTLGFLPDSSATNPIKEDVGAEFPLDVQVNPGTNIVSFVKLEIDYDETKLATSEAADGFKVNEAAFPVVLEGPVFSPGKIQVTLSVGSDPTAAIQQTTKALTVKFKTLASTNGQPTNITYGQTTEVLSIGGQDQSSENVLLNVAPAAVVIGGTGTTTPGAGTPTVMPTDTPMPTAIPQPTTPPAPTDVPTPTGPTPTPGPTVANQLPLCTALNIDRETTGTAPYSITFTAVGNDPDGTVNTVTFNYGDGPVEPVTQTGGIGTATVDVQRAHTYTNPGTYTASATLTDNMGGTSDMNSCKTQIIVLAAPTGTGGGGNMTPMPSATMAKPGPGDEFVGIGIAAALFTVIGGIVFFAL